MASSARADSAPPASMPSCAQSASTSGGFTATWRSLHVLHAQHVLHAPSAVLRPAQGALRFLLRRLAPATWRLCGAFLGATRRGHVRAWPLPRSADDRDTT